ncbi:MAG: HAD hydrolase family protein [Flavobacteriaceae bacterium]|nr:HAD hydrolase family protein [Flavobacteriaceae bacterium]
MIPKDHLIIAIDFDGTIVEDAYPKVGTPMIFAFETIKKLQEDGHRLILWTYRSGRKLQEAVDFCKENGIDFYAINKNYPEEEFDEKLSRKIHADLFIDDRNIGGFLGWTEIYKLIFNHEPEVPKKKGFFSRFK